MTRLTGLRRVDARFSISLSLDGSDAMNPDPDYSACHVVLATDDRALSGRGLIFTIGRGNDICVAAVVAIRHFFIGLELDWVREDAGRFWRFITGDSKLRWIGPDKGAIISRQARSSTRCGICRRKRKASRCGSLSPT